MAITNGITQAALTTDLRMANVISQEVRLLLRDVNNLRNSPYVDFVGSINGLGTDTIRVAKAGLDGRDVFSVISPEDTALSANTGLTKSSVDCVVQRAGLRYQITDMASMTAYAAGGNNVDVFRIAQSMAGSYEAYFADLTADTIDDFTAAAGPTGAVMTVDGLLDAIFTLEKADGNRGVPGPFAGIVHPKQFTELQDDLRNESNSIFSYSPATLDAISAKGPGFVGRFLNVDLYTSSYVNTSGGGDLQGAIFGAGALGYATGIPADLAGASDFMAMGDIVVEMERDAATASTIVIGHAYLGMCIIDDNRGCRLVSVA
jgi:hypothetical protein